MPPRSTDHFRAALRLISLGMTVTQAAEATHIERRVVSKYLHSEEGSAYMRHLQDLADHYAACMSALGLVPADVIRPKRGRPVKPSPNVAGFRKAAGEARRARHGLPDGPRPERGKRVKAGLRKTDENQHGPEKTE
jgi:hypothetical protein